MRMLILGFVLGWTVNIGVREIQDFQFFDLEIDALNLDIPRVGPKRTRPLEQYVENNRYKFLDIVNYRPNLWTCRFIFDHHRCPIKSLLRSPLPLSERGKL